MKRVSAASKVFICVGSVTVIGALTVIDAYGSKDRLRKIEHAGSINGDVRIGTAHDAVDDFHNVGAAGAVR